MFTLIFPFFFTISLFKVIAQKVVILDKDYLSVTFPADTHQIASAAAVI